MQYIFTFVQKHLLWLIILAIGSGLIFTKLTGGYAFTPVICLLAALVMIYPSLVPLEFDRISEVAQHKQKIVWTIIINFVVSPLVALVLGWLFLQSEPSLWLGLILLSILPGGGMVTTWAFKSRADMPLTISIVFVNLLAAIVIVPLVLSWTMNKLSLLYATAEKTSCLADLATRGKVSCFFSSGGSISPLKIALPILFIIVIPLVLAFVTQKLLRKRKSEAAFAKIKQQFASISNIGMLILLFVLMGIKDNIVIFQHPELIIKALTPLALFYGVTLSISWQIYKKIKNAEGKALLWGTYLRYITLALGLAISLVYQNPQYNLAVIMVVLAYLIQIPSSFWLAKKLNK